MDGFLTSIFRDGDWVTTVVSTQQALAATSRKIEEEEEEALRFDSVPPQCGIMTRTIIPSPIAHLILPVRIRSRSQIDVAFIGVSHSIFVDGNTLL